MSNLKIWEKVEKTNPAHTKKVTFGRAITAIDPYHQIRNATEQFGPVGEGWGYAVKDVHRLPTDELCVIIEMWHSGDPSKTFCHAGQSSYYTDNAKSKPDKDCMKKAITDGVTKCLSIIGFNADVFLGKFDDNKYVAALKAEADPKKGNITTAKGALKDVYMEIGACADIDQLDLYLNNDRTKKLIARFWEVIPEQMQGDGSFENCGFDGTVNKRRKYIEENTDV